MPVNLASPGIRVREVDLTVGRVDPASGSIGGLVAPFAQGPVDLPIAIGSEKDLLDTFGKPYSNDNHYEHWLTASSYLAYGGQMRIVRTDDDNLFNARSNGAALKVKNVEDYEVKLYDENDVTGRTIFAKNPGSWANGIRVSVIDSKVDQVLTIPSVSGIDTGVGVRQSVNTFTDDNIVVSAGQTSPLTGYFKGIVTEVDATKNQIGVKFVSVVDGDGVETATDYVQGGLYRFRKNNSITFVNAGAGSTSATVSRGALGSNAVVAEDGTQIDSFYRSNAVDANPLAMSGGGDLAHDGLIIGVNTTGLTVGADRFLVIGEEMISLAGATIGTGQVTVAARGTVGTAVTHTDDSDIAFLQKYTNVGDLTEDIVSSTTTIGITASEDLSSKVNSGGILQIGSQYMRVTSFFDGGSLEQTPSAESDWFNAQKIKTSKELVGGSLVDREINWNSVAERPGTSNYAAGRGSRFDEVHVVVIDGDGRITGNAGTILEKHLNLSKASDAVFSAGSPSYWRSYIKSNSANIFAGDQPTTVVPLGFDSTSFTPTSDNDWNQPAENTAGVPIIFGGAGNKNYSLSGGTDYDGNSTVTSTNALKPNLSKIISGYELFENKENYTVDFLLMGSANYGKEATASLASQIISIAERRKDAVAFVSPYRGALLSETSSSNGLSTNTLNDEETITDRILSYYTSVPSSSYGIFDSGYKYMYDRFANTFRYVPLNGDIAGLCARNDIDNFPWFSPAGTSRGAILNAVKLAYNPSQSQRDRLYSARINPVIFSPGSGIILFGDKTGLAKASAFDRINVRRLFIYLEDAISAAARDQLFEFNDEITRTNFVNIVEPFLRDVQAKRGIQDYVVICDQTNNTGAVIDNNEFVADIYVKPARSINFIGLTFVATRSGVSFDEVIGNV